MPRFPFPFPRRRLALLLPLSLVLTVLLLLYLYHLYQTPPPTSHIRRPPPNASQLQELRASGQKYVTFRQLRGAGFNNQLQETLLLSFLAAKSGRAYVYKDLIWRPRGYDTVPLEYFVGGPITTAPNVHESVFDLVCEEGEREDVWEYGPEEGRVGRVLEALGGGGRCVSVRERIMDWGFLEHNASLALYEPIIPHIRQFKWSTYVQEAYERSIRALKLEGKRYMALHIRRGDFYYHCPLIAHDQKPFNLWARLPFLPSALSSPSLPPETVLSHCWPSFAQMLHIIWDAKVSYERRWGERLEAVYVLHDAKWDAPWVWILVRRLEYALSRPPFSMRFVDSAWLPLEWEERDLGIAVDMEIARRAEVFVGNGFSSLTSNVVLLRLADGREWGSSRFW